ncbi:uncharacterized protein LOC129728721 isoform X2 [Wyeomyia smithii]|uniref:uncharacterized protein LOC129728721 isoform X2 n=1 Tax=Wyeomyia smithii TaxID=174621 RepID=UPI002467C30C|nr:uncharacterized protein LOC129728721 isoform X2 [Wyeomyia smithii]
MAVLLSYHRLIEKDSKYINNCWKSSILVILFVSISSSVAITFSLQSLKKSFRNNCFMGAKPSFIHSSGLITANNNITCHSNSVYSVGETCVIDELTSKWNNQDFCEYLIYTPLFHALTGVIWLALFSMHGPGGKGNGSIIAKPWRIIFPSFIFFVLCAISALICASVGGNALKEFCDEFNKVHLNDDFDCGQMILYFSWQENDELIRPDKSYYLLKVFPWIWATSYITGTLVMLLRILLVTDFQLMKIVISTISKETDDDDYEQQSIDNLKENVVINSKPLEL